MDKSEALNRILEIVSGYTAGGTLPAMVEIQAICKGALADMAHMEEGCPGHGKCGDQGCPAHYASGGKP